MHRISQSSNDDFRIFASKIGSKPDESSTFHPPKLSSKNQTLDRGILFNRASHPPRQSAIDQPRTLIKRTEAHARAENSKIARRRADGVSSFFFGRLVVCSGRFAG